MLSGNRNIGPSISIYENDIVVAENTKKQKDNIKWIWPKVTEDRKMLRYGYNKLIDIQQLIKKNVGENKMV